MLVTLHGETLSLGDKAGIRRHSRQHAAAMVNLIKGSKRLRKEFTNFFADVYFLKVIAGAALAECQLNKDLTMPVSDFEEVMTYINAIVGEANATVVPLDPNAEIPQPKPIVEVVEGYSSNKLDETASTSVDGH